MNAPYRLGIDMGTNSLGWCVLDLNRKGEPSGIRRMGARIFSDGRDPQSGTSLAVERRVPRGQRRRRDRYLDRRTDLMAALVRHGLMPEDPTERKKLESLDPYELRTRGLDRSLPLHHFGRALFHLNQRRGFKSNRKTDKSGDEKETEGIKGAITALEVRMREAGARTLGEYLYKTCRENRSVRQCAPVRARRKGIGAKAEYERYPSRDMYEKEFQELWAKQKEFHPQQLTDDVRDELRDIIFYQRPLRPVDPGKCTLDPTDQRAPEALPMVQRFRMYQELANLKIERAGEASQFLTKKQRDDVFEKLERTKELSFDRIRALLRLDSGARFNLESERRKGLKGDATGILLASKNLFGPRWWKLDDDPKATADQQNTIVETLLVEESDERLVAIAVGEWNLDEAMARKLANAPLPRGYGRLGRRALGQIVPWLRDNGSEGRKYDDAVRQFYPHHSDFRTGEIFDELPYYGEALERHVAFGTGNPGDPPEKRFGRIANPTVHIGLNELRKVVDSIIAKYGPPESVVVELARELKLGRQRQQEIERRQTENQKKNDERRKLLAELKLPDNGENLLKLRLWEELGDGPHDRRCVYTGEPISGTRLFGPEVEIEHILPFKRTLDNSPANKTVSMRYANRAKGNQSPHEVFHDGPTIDGRKYDWPDILGRADSLPKNKRWRFQPDAMERYKSENDFLDRQLVDTQYLSRVTKEYLTRICDPDKVWVTPGRLTEMLRGKWGLNRLLADHNLKNRFDHRHHAIDAFVTGVTDRWLLNEISRAADQHRDRLIDDMPEPQMPNFREQLRDRLDGVVVSHKPDHGKQGKLHEATAYGIVRDPILWEGATLVSRKPIEDLTAAEIERVRDLTLRERLRGATNECIGNKVALKKVLAEFAATNRMRRVRLLKVEAAFVQICNAGDTPYKAYIPGDNHHIDIYATPGSWAGEAVTVFDANQPGHVPHWRQKHPDAALIMSVHKGDLLKLEHDGKERMMRVVRLNAKASRLYLAEHHESGDLQKRHDDPDDPFRWLLASYSTLKERRARKVTVDVLGRVRDPGPPS